MKRIAPAHLPRMREEALVIDDLPDEVLVYDLNSHKAHCLNQTAALIWRRCDGRTTPAEIASRLRIELKRPFDEDLVWMALRRLQQLHLLKQPIFLPPQPTSMPRRKMMRRLGLAAAVAVPMIVSIVSPTPVQASTCVASGQPCNGSIACCSTLPCGSVISGQCP